MERPLSTFAPAWLGLRHDGCARCRRAPARIGIQGLRRADLHPDPIEQSSTWFSTAVSSAPPDVNAICLATATLDGKPSARMVLLKGFDQRGFVFLPISGVPKGASWRQIRRLPLPFTGATGKANPGQRPDQKNHAGRSGRLFLFASAREPARRNLDARRAEMEERFTGGAIELPPHGGGYRLEPNEIEFWQGRANRLHDRFRCTLGADGAWTIDRLAPWSLGDFFSRRPGSSPAQHRARPADEKDGGNAKRHLGTSARAFREDDRYFPDAQAVSATNVGSSRATRRTGKSPASSRMRSRVPSLEASSTKTISVGEIPDFIICSINGAMFSASFNVGTMIETDASLFIGYRFRPSSRGDIEEFSAGVEHNSVRWVLWLAKGGSVNMAACASRG